MKSNRLFVALVCAMGLISVAFAQEEDIPFYKAGPDNATPSQSEILGPEAGPPRAVALAITSSPALATNFVAAVDDGDNRIPPDTYGAVGESNLMIMLNTFVKIHDRNGSLVTSNKLTNWWGSVTLTMSRPAYDPRIIYEPYNKRWVAIAIDGQNTANSGLLDWCLAIGKSCRKLVPLADSGRFGRR